MLHAFDSSPPEHANPRSEWMAVLARAPLPMLEETLAPYQAQRDIEWLRKPETGLYMVQGRAGGTGERFNVGEVTVTRCALRRIETDATPSPVGVAYVLGRDQRQAKLVALADALLQEAAHHGELQQSLIAPARAHLAKQNARLQGRAQSTKVDFFTVAREAGQGGDEESEE
jgi:alpha-D-ribose 1-methylphosphonate 5-triphosphate synthase subunit PhnG